jgi:WS/DGAT/MGAT family acyltransferase
MDTMKHLSIVDGAFLHMESAEMPMHVGSLHVFELPGGDRGDWYETVKQHVAGRLHLASVFTRKLALMPFDLANPVWIEDDDIDLDYHIRQTVLPRPGNREQLEALAARLHSSMLDRSRPLWEFYVVDGLEPGPDGARRMGFYAKVHHAAIDGQAGVALANAVYDLGPEPRAVRAPRHRRGNRYQLGVAELLTAALENQLRQVVDLARLLPSVAGRAVGAARRAWARRGGQGDGMEAESGKGKASRWRLAPVTPFNASVTNQRRFAGVVLPLAQVKVIGKAHGASINDMVLWLCGTALRTYLKEARELPAASLVAGVPISLRAEGDTRSNNQVAGTVMSLATDVADPLERLAAIKAASMAMKAGMGSWRDIIPTDFPSIGSPWLLSGLTSLYGRSRMADRLRVANVTISNVPGPRVPLYLAGARMLDYLPVSIVVHGVALNITVQSYEDQLGFGLVACRRAVPDLKDLAIDLQRAWAELQKLPVPAAEAVAAAEGAPEPARRSPPARPARQAAAPRKLRAKAASPRGPTRKTAPQPAPKPGRKPEQRAEQRAAREPPPKPVRLRAV